MVMGVAVANFFDEEGEEEAGEESGGELEAVVAVELQFGE